MSYTYYREKYKNPSFARVTSDGVVSWYFRRSNTWKTSDVSESYYPVYLKRMCEEITEDEFNTWLMLQELNK